MYSSKLLLQIGHIQIENNSDDECKSGSDSESESESETDSENDLGIGVPDYEVNDIGKQLKETILTTLFKHNDEEIYEYYESKNLQLICFKQLIDKITFIPNLKIIKSNVYHNLGLGDLKNLQNDIKNTPRDSYIVLGLLDFDMLSMPNNFLFYFKNKLMSKFLNKVRNIEHCRKINRGIADLRTDGGNWIMILYKRPNETMIIDERKYVNSNIFKNNVKWNKLYTRTQNTLDLIDSNRREIEESQCNNNNKTKYKSQENLVYLGEAFSYNIAEIKLDLKNIPYILNRL